MKTDMRRTGSSDDWVRVGHMLALGSETEGDAVLKALLGADDAGAADRERPP